MPKRKSGNYEVGYGKPPKAFQFKPGQSPNPSGRPKRVPELSELLGKELKRKRYIIEDGQRLAIPTFHILIKRLIELAGRGDIRALFHALSLADLYLKEERKVESLKLPAGDMTLEEAQKAYAELRKMDVAELRKMIFPRR